MGEADVGLRLRLTRPAGAPDRTPMRPAAG